jgi:hypothetical protein
MTQIDSPGTGITIIYTRLELDLAFRSRTYNYF